jgi:hypothetical protein
MEPRIDIGRYRELLHRIRQYLSGYGDRRWPPILDEWLAELAACEGSSTRLEEHLRRTRRAVSGMGSLGDVFISPESGHRIADDDETVHEANGDLLSLVRSLDREVAELLERSRP